MAQTVPPCGSSIMYPAAAVTVSGFSEITVQPVNEKYLGKYTQFDGIVKGGIYVFTIYDKDKIKEDNFITVRKSDPVTGPIVGYGQSPLIITSDVSGTLYAVWSKKDNCATNNDKRTVSIQALYSDNWMLGGNQDVDATNNIIGTVPDLPFRIITNNSEKVTITGTGNVGIGTTLPQRKLDVQGSIGSLSLYSDSIFVNHLFMTNPLTLDYLNVNKKLQVGTTVITPGRIHVDTLTPTLIEMLPISQILGNTFVDGSGYYSQSLGIGVTSPTERLDVDGNIKASGTVIADTVKTENFVLNNILDVEKIHAHKQIEIGNSIIIQGEWPNPLNLMNHIYTDNSVPTTLYIQCDPSENHHTVFGSNNSAFVGIGTPADPTERLDVNGNIKTTGIFKSTYNSGAPFEIASATLVTNLNADMLDGQHASAFALAGSQGTGTPGEVAFWNTSSSLTSDPDLFWDNPNKRLGIGTIIPTEKLEVMNGHLKVGGANGYITMGHDGGNAFISSYNNGRLLINYDSGKDVVIGNLGNNNEGNGKLTVWDKVGIGTDADEDVALHVKDKTYLPPLTASRETDGTYLRIENHFSDGSSDNNSWYDFIANSGRSFLLLQSQTGGISKSIIAFTQNGRVGIGTTEPRQKLEIIGSVLVNGNTNSLFFSDEIPQDYGKWGIKYENDGLNFWRPNGHGNPMPQRGNCLFLKDNGNIGIATNNPLSRLHIISSGSDANTSALNITKSDNTSIIYVRDDGNVGIGTTCPDATLAVNGKIHTKDEITVDNDGGWCDYVFEKDYKLMPIEELEDFINTNKHLPEIPTAAEVDRDGIKLAEMNRVLLKKVEELTLYVIQQEKRLNQQQQEIRELKNSRTD